MRVLVAAPQGCGGVASAVDAVVPRLGPGVRRCRPARALAGDADVVHLHPSLRPRSLARDALVARAARARGAAVVLSLHGWDPALAERLDRYPQLRGLLRADAVSVLARPFAERLAAWGIEAEVVPNAIDPACLPDARRPTRTVLFLGRLVPGKRVDVLVDAVARLPGVELVVAGDGPERVRLEGRARLLGWVDAARKRELLATAGVLALPSRGEAFPVAVAEALAAGVPVVASGGGALPDLVGEAGVVDPPDWAVALREALDHPPPPAVGRVRALCDPDAVAARWRTLYDRALARRRAP